MHIHNCFITWTERKFNWSLLAKKNLRKYKYCQRFKVKMNRMCEQMGFTVEKWKLKAKWKFEK